MSVIWFLLATALRAFFAVARSALVNMRRSRLAELGQRGVASARVMEQLTENSSRLLATAEVGAIFSLVLAAGIAATSFVPPTEAWINGLGAAWLPAGVALAIAYVIEVFITGMVLFIFGRLIPEAIAVRNPEPIALSTVRLMQISSVLLSPMVRLAVTLSNLLSLPLGSQRREGGSLVTEEELKTLVDAGEEEGLIEEDEKEMILSVLDFGDTVAREVMVPRIDMVAVEVSTDFEQALDLIIASGHSRVPVYRETIDDIVGLLYVKDMLKALRDRTPQPPGKLARQAYFTPESKKVSELLQELQNRRVHVCIVVDEYGGTAGMVTIEDILEEIVGEIQDEYDTEEPDFQPLPDGEGYILEAGMAIDDANELLHIEMPTDQSDTLGGFIYDQLGEVPAVGATVHYAGLLFEVLAINDRRILKVKVTHEQPQEQDEDHKADSKAQDNTDPDRDHAGNGRSYGLN
ncbi:MAG: hemolysin family protein [Chloroflexi bacterium]|nr:hemolysin family protein [Chloroflexota bacterium]MCL5273123.1 hemolysin family protein [Chloroflexota bacterium]